MKAQSTLFTSRQQLWWWVSVATFSIANFSVSVPLAATLYQVHVVVAFVIGLLQTGSIALSLATPRLGVASWIVGTALFLVFGEPVPNAPWPLDVNGLLALCALLLSLGLRRPVWEGVATWALGVATPLVALIFVGVGATPGASAAGVVANLVSSTAISAFVLLLAILVAQRGRARGELAAEQQRRMLVEERNRIARELHDVVAHSMSVIQVQASSAPYRLPQLDEATRDEFGDIAASARSAMREMRQLLGVLRSEDASVEEMPQPGIAQIAELVRSLERAGTNVSVDIDPSLPSDGVASAAAYRIVQESLSNVVRHAPGATAEVRAELVDRAILLSVENTAPTGSGVGLLAKGGHGLTGMRERAALLGGTVDARPTVAGGFRVFATLPLISASGFGADAHADASAGSRATILPSASTDKDAAHS